ncbi:MAG: dTMP kinase [Candidatus Odinarchaeum yellowstonii]|uniref:Probable thymidylate kinase n=1 Tax=Odinarchaeota yellowstonii (strain LCB_4) TaxID=1841599 RepID=A0AAF0IAY1_ODILC|nr:MAG: dTMP kinase [Candidatus Odinarchaeum yellowstonii]
MLIDFEGIDGAGTETWSKFTLKYILEKGGRAVIYRFPDYNSPWGKIIRSYLDGQIELDVDVQFLTYSTDILKEANNIRRDLQDNKIVLTDRYILSTMAYQCSKSFPVEKALSFYRLFNFPKPDYVILLLTSSEISKSRKLSENKALDRHERDDDLLKKVSDNYIRFSREKYICEKWFLIDTSGDLEVTEKILEDILKLILK